jgi:hypothetical protein
MNWSYFKKWIEPPNAIALLLVLATLALFCATRSLVTATRTLVTDSDRASEHQLRAYVQASPGHVYNLVSGAKLEAYIQIGNSGQTPGNGVRRWAGIKISKLLSADETAELGPGDREEGILVSMPRQEHVIIRQLGAPTATESQAIINGAQRIYVFGHLEYFDIFDHPRASDFCFMYYGEVQDWPKNGGPGYNSTQARYCEKHNSAN